MLKGTLCLLVGVLAWGFASCSVPCPDGSSCPDLTTCCSTTRGYNCCPYPNAVCCTDKAHCCPFGYICNMATMMCEKHGQPWMAVPMVQEEAEEEKPTVPLQPLAPTQELQSSLEQSKSSVVWCDSYTHCPDATTCCRHPKGGWFCCPYYPGRCCLDGFHCCPYGYDCDHTYTKCVRQGLKYPFPERRALASFPASRSRPEDKNNLEEHGQPWMAVPMVQEEAAEEKPTVPLQPLAPIQEFQSSLEQSKSSVVWCDSCTHCPDATTCCKHPKGGWFCCPYSPGRCCLDGFHCCPYGYDCDHTYTKCVRQGLKYPYPERRALASFPASRSRPEDKNNLEEKPMMVLTEAMTSAQDGGVIRCDNKFYCPAGRSCCQGAQGQWSCCPYKLGQCCADGKHCCNYGSTCSATSSSCQTSFAQIL